MIHPSPTVPAMPQDKPHNPLTGTLHSGRPAPTLSAPPLDMGPTLISEQSATLSDDASPGRTIVGHPTIDPSALASTLADPAASSAALAQTMADPAPPSMTQRSAALSAAPRHSTMLPKLSGSLDRPELVFEARPRFETVSTLGQGGMGVVELVKDHDIGRTVAVKRMTGGEGNPINVARFVEEVGTVGRLEHPNIVPLYDAGVDEHGRYFFVMKRLDGETLEHIIDRLRARDPAYQARYTFEARVQIFMGLLRALEYTHARQIIHRDIKPANIMVGPFGEVVLMDWGIAKPIGQMSHEPGLSENELFASKDEARARLLKTRHGALLGTPAYMSPEQAEGLVHKLDARSDLYSACVVMHELLTLEHYIGADHPSLMSMLHAVMHKEATFEVCSIRAEDQEPIPAEWSYFLMRGLDKDPAKRFSSAHEMILEIERMQSGQIHVQCGMTLTRRGMFDLMRVINQRGALAAAIGMPMHAFARFLPQGFEARNPNLSAALVFISLTALPLLAFTLVWTALLVAILR